MNPREELIDLLIGGAEVAGNAAARVGDENTWPAIFEIAANWSVLPNLRTRLTELQAPLSSDLKNRLFTLFQETFVSSTLQARRGIAVCRSIEDRGFPAVVFKGLASIAHLHQGKPAARTIKDVDILVREADLERVLGVMEDLGMKPEHGGDLARYVSFVRNSPGFAGNQAITVGGDGMAEVDVHWSIGPRTAAEFRAEAIIERSGWVDLLGSSIRVISPGDGLLLSAHHAIRENFAPDGMLRDVLDTLSWMKLLESRRELSIRLEQARLFRIEDVVLALAEIHAARGARVPLRSSLSPRPTSPRAAELAGLFWLQARNGPLGKDLMYLADPHSLWQIVRGIFSGWDGYTAQMDAIETRLTGKPVSLRQRLANVARQAPRYGFRARKMIRALARSKAAYQRDV